MAPTAPTLDDLDEDSDDALYYHLIGEDDRLEPGVGRLFISPSRAEPEDENFGFRNHPDDYERCLKDVLDVFPDISHEHVHAVYNKHMETRNPFEAEPLSQALIEKILDSGHYPKEKERRKRKFSDRDSEEEEAARWKYKHLTDDPTQYQTVAQVALQDAFEYVPVKFIDAIFKEHRHYYGAFFAILEAERGLNSSPNPGFTRLKSRRQSNRSATAMIAQLEQSGYDFENLKQEIDSAFQRRKRDEATRTAAKDAKQAEEIEDQRLRAMGDVIECQCCYDECVPPKMTHCDGEECHFFCLDCARSNANSVIGNSRYILQCMDGSGCKASFSRHERSRFLDEKTIEKLERLQQQDEIRMAELKNLSTCPFCDFAAICPPIEEDREFRCHNPICEEVSCRLCKAKTHIPLSCEEFKKETGVSERRVIEEARTEALIRTCGKCQVRILKEDGCNKVICTSCSAVLCDYCGQDISKAMYNHFDGQGRAPPGVMTNGPGAKCPLYDESNKRKDRQVEEAEKEAMAKVRAEHPDLSEDDLKIKFAKSVQSTARPQHWGGHRHPPMAFNGVDIPPFAAMLNERHRPVARYRVEMQPPVPANFGEARLVNNPLHQGLHQLPDGQQQQVREDSNAQDPVLQRSPQQLAAHRQHLRQVALMRMQQQVNRHQVALQQQQQQQQYRQQWQQHQQHRQQRQQQQQEVQAEYMELVRLNERRQAYRQEEHARLQQLNESMRERDRLQRMSEVLENAARHESRRQQRGAHLADLERQRATLLDPGLYGQNNPFNERNPYAANGDVGNGVFGANVNDVWLDNEYQNRNHNVQNPLNQPNSRVTANNVSGNPEGQRHQIAGASSQDAFSALDNSVTPGQYNTRHRRASQGSLVMNPWLNQSGTGDQPPQDHGEY